MPRGRVIKNYNGYYYVDPGSGGAVCQGSSVKASVEGASGSRQPLTQGRVLPARQIEFRQTP